MKSMKNNNLINQMKYGQKKDSRCHMILLNRYQPRILSIRKRIYLLILIILFRLYKLVDKYLAN